MYQKIITVTALLAVILLPPIVQARGTMNISERPSLAFSNGLSKATKALKDGADNLVCIGAESKTRSSGGGWSFLFSSQTLHSRYVEVDKDGKVVANNNVGDSGKFKAPPRLSIQKVMKTALGTRAQSGQWYVLYCNWHEEKDEWYVAMANIHRELDGVFINARGKPRAQKR